MNGALADPRQTKPHAAASEHLESQCGSVLLICMLLILLLGPTGQIGGGGPNHLAVCCGEMKDLSLMFSNPSECDSYKPDDIIYELGPPFQCATADRETSLCSSPIRLRVWYPSWTERSSGTVLPTGLQPGLCFCVEAIGWLRFRNF